MNYNIISIGDKLYTSYRVIRNYKDLNIEGLKKLWNCDTAFKKQDHLYFCREIPEIEFEEIEENENQLCDTSVQ